MGEAYIMIFGKAHIPLLTQYLKVNPFSAINQIQLNLQKAVLAALNVEHGAAGEGLSEVEKKASLEVSLIMNFASREVITSLYHLGQVVQNLVLK